MQAFGLPKRVSSEEFIRMLREEWLWQFGSSHESLYLYVVRGEDISKYVAPSPLNSSGSSIINIVKAANNLSAFPNRTIDGDMNKYIREYVKLDD